MIEQTLQLPNFPSPETARTLSPNGRAHWTTRRKARLNVVDVVTVHAIKAGLRRMRGHVTLHPVFVYPQARKRDDDNLATGVMKAVRDCLVNGGWLDADDVQHLQQMPVVVRVEKGVRALELRFVESES